MNLTGLNALIKFALAEDGSSSNSWFERTSCSASSTRSLPMTWAQGLGHSGWNVMGLLVLFPRARLVQLSVLVVTLRHSPPLT